MGPDPEGPESLVWVLGFVLREKPLTLLRLFYNYTPYTWFSHMNIFIF